LLDDTLVLWGGEFGRTVLLQGRLTETNYGRDHHPRCFTCGLPGRHQAGVTIGETDDFCYNVVSDRCTFTTSRHAAKSTRVDHKRLTYKFQGRYFA